MSYRYQLVALSRSDGGVSIMQFVLEDGGGRLVDGTDEEIEAEVQKVSHQQPAPVVSWRRISAADRPQSREYRDAWTDRAGVIAHDMSKARDIHRKRIRARRKPMLESLDVEYQRADEAEDRQEKRRVAALKQRLRDATMDPRIEAALTIEELKAVDPLTE